MKHRIGAILFIVLTGIYSSVIAATLISDDVLDAALDVVMTTTRVYIVTDASTPSNTANNLGYVNVTAGDGNGDWALSDEGTGRKAVLAAQSNISPSGSGTARHIMGYVNNTFVWAIDITDAVVTEGSTMNLPSVTITFAQPE